MCVNRLVLFSNRSAWLATQKNLVHIQWKNIRVWKISLNCIFLVILSGKLYGMSKIGCISVQKPRNNWKDSNDDETAIIPNRIKKKKKEGRINMKRQCLSMVYRDKVLTIYNTKLKHTPKPQNVNHNYDWINTHSIAYIMILFMRRLMCATNLGHGHYFLLLLSDMNTYKLYKLHNYCRYSHNQIQIMNVFILFNVSVLSLKCRNFQIRFIHSSSPFHNIEKKFPLKNFNREMLVDRMKIAYILYIILIWMIVLDSAIGWG